MKKSTELRVGFSKKNKQNSQTLARLTRKKKTQKKNYK